MVNKMNKRGVIEVQFNWIFTLIVGALILSLFTVIIVKQKDSSELKACTTVINELETTLVAAKSSTGTLNIVRIPDSKIEFSCSDYSHCNIQKQIRDKLIFSSNTIEGRVLITWALEWKIPYKVTNFLYLTSPLNRYIFVGNLEEDVVLNTIDSSFPDEINKETVVDLSSISDKNHKKVRVVYFNQNVDSKVPSSFLNMGQDISVVQIEGNLNVGTVKFYSNSGGIFTPKRISSYLGKESLIGAIFMEDYENYECTLGKAFKNYNIVSDIYKNKIDKIKESPMDLACGHFHTLGLGDVEDIFGKSSDINKKLSNQEGIIINDVDSIFSNIISLNDTNENLQINSCPLIY